MRAAPARLAVALLTLGLVGATAPGSATAQNGEAPELRTYYEAGIPFGDFLAEADRREDQWHDHYRDGAPSAAAIERARALPGPAYILAIAEDWCGDSVNTVPYLARLVEQVEQLDMRVIDSTLGKPLMETRVTPDGRTATPTLVLLDGQYREIASWVERPSGLQEWFLANEEGLPRRQLYDRKYEWYDEDRGATTVAEITGLFEAGLASEQTTAEVGSISPDELLVRRERGDQMLILDVRTAEEFAASHVPGAINIPYDEIAEHLATVREAGDVDIVVYCRSGRRAAVAEGVLGQNDFRRLLHLEGDMLRWLERGLPVEKTDG